MRVPGRTLRKLNAIKFTGLFRSNQFANKLNRKELVRTTIQWTYCTDLEEATKVPICGSTKQWKCEWGILGQKDFDGLQLLQLEL